MTAVDHDIPCFNPEEYRKSSNGLYKLSIEQTQYCDRVNDLFTKVWSLDITELEW